MLIYHDFFTDDEVCTDANKITVEKGIMRVYCKYVKRSTDVACNTGANASQEEQAEEYEDSGEESGIDVCINHGLEDCTSFYGSAKDYNKYLKSYVKQLGKKLKKKGSPEKLKELLEAFNELKEIVTKNEDDIQFFKAPYRDNVQAQADDDDDDEDKLPPESFHIPCQRINDQGDSVMYFFHCGLREEKA